MNNSWVQIGLGVSLGAAAGLLYFALLWVALRHLLHEQSPTRTAVTLLLSYLIRLALILAIFYWLATINLIALLAGVSSFTAVALITAGKNASPGAS